MNPATPRDRVIEALPVRPEWMSYEVLFVASEFKGPRDSFDHLIANLVRNGSILRAGSGFCVRRKSRKYRKGPEKKVVAVNKQITSQPMTVGQRIRGAREALEMTQMQLAAQVGVSAGSVYYWEKDDCLPRRKKLERLEDVLNIKGLVERVVGDRALPKKRIWLGECGHPVSTKTAKRCRPCLIKAAEARRVACGGGEQMPEGSRGLSLLVESQENQIEVLLYQLSVTREVLAKIACTAMEGQIKVLANEGLLGLR